jgi:hypothetical protein
MVLEPVCCPDCGSEDVVKNGKSNEGKQRYLCRHQNCRRRSFIRDYSYQGYLPSIKQQIVDMAVNSDLAPFSISHVRYRFENGFKSMLCNDIGMSSDLPKQLEPNNRREQNG